MASWTAKTELKIFGCIFHKTEIQTIVICRKTKNWSFKHKYHTAADVSFKKFWILHTHRKKEMRLRTIFHFFLVIRRGKNFFFSPISCERDFFCQNKECKIFLLGPPTFLRKEKKLLLPLLLPFFLTFFQPKLCIRQFSAKQLYIRVYSLNFFTAQIRALGREEKIASQKFPFFHFWPEKRGRKKAEKSFFRPLFSTELEKKGRRKTTFISRRVSAENFVFFDRKRKKVFESRSKAEEKEKKGDLFFEHFFSFPK